MLTPARALPLLLLLPLAIGCGVGDASGPEGSEPGDTTDGDDGDTPEPTGGTLEGDVTEDLALDDLVEVNQDAVIRSGATVTILPGAQMRIAEGVSITVEGSLAIAGTEDAPVSIEPREDAAGWSGFTAASGGSVSIEHATGSKVGVLLTCSSGASLCEIHRAHFEGLGQSIIANDTASITESEFRNMANAGVRIDPGGNLSIVDSIIFTSTHDLIVSTGGQLSIDHSEVGGASGSYEHCDVHIGASDKVTITNSNLVSAVVGMMIGGTSNAVIQYNNFESNESLDVEQVGAVSAIDLRYNYFDNLKTDFVDAGAFDTSEASPTRHEEAGPRVAL